MSLKRIISVGATLLILTVAVVLVRTLWLHYMDSPWTRDGRVRADVINIAPDVAGLVADVLVRDNQKVKAGDLLLRIDPAHYQVAVKQAEALVAARKAALDMRKVNADRRADMDDLVVSRESREDAGHLAASALAEYQEAVAALDAAKLNLARSEVRAPVSGHITNLNVYAPYRDRIVGDGNGRNQQPVDRPGDVAGGFFDHDFVPLERRRTDQRQSRLLREQQRLGCGRRRQSEAGVVGVACV